MWLLGRAPAGLTKLPIPTSLVGAVPEPDITDGEPAAGDLTVHQQAGEAAAAAGP